MNALRRANDLLLRDCIAHYDRMAHGDRNDQFEREQCSLCSEYRLFEDTECTLGGVGICPINGRGYFRCKKSPFNDLIKSAQLDDVGAELEIHQDTIFYDMLEEMIEFLIGLLSPEWQEVYGDCKRGG